VGRRPPLSQVSRAAGLYAGKPQRGPKPYPARRSRPAAAPIAVPTVSQRIRHGRHAIRYDAEQCAFAEESDEPVPDSQSVIVSFKLSITVPASSASTAALCGRCATPSSPGTHTARRSG
jgi:hypothetical protein